jgi:L-alanine-DL-glutamate epimerase-like enolase superfamily enzyme
VKVTGIRAYRQSQPFREARYGTSGGSESGFDSLIVAIDTDDGFTGWGEMAPLGSFYSPAFAAGARAGIEELAPLLVGLTLTHPGHILRLLDRTLQGHPYIKSAIDMACWDILAQRANQPLCELTGGRDGDGVPLYRAIPLTDPDAAVQRAQTHVDQGYRRLQIKVGGSPLADAERLTMIRDALDPDIVLFADANGAWTTHQARRFLAASTHLDIALEQPCATIAECRAIRAHCPHPMILDESIDSLEALLRAHHDGVADGVTLKISRLGGITRTLLLRDVATELGIPVTIEDTGGGTIDTAAILHLAHSTPRHLQIHTLDFNSWITTDHGTGIPEPRDGHISAPIDPGLGITVQPETLGEPFMVLGPPWP